MAGDCLVGGVGEEKVEKEALIFFLIFCILFIYYYE
jgi:hypothetical protein